MDAKTKIKVIGIGGAGGNAIDRMMRSGIEGVELIAFNTDAQDLKKIKAHLKLQLGKEGSGGSGAGMNPDIGRKAALEAKEEIGKVLEGTDLVFLAAGLGGGTGGGAIPFVAEMAKERKILSVAIATLPFSFEGAWRARLARAALDALRGKVDTLLVISNDKILGLGGEDITVADAFWQADEILREAVQGVSDLIVRPGLINVDFADMRSVMEHAGSAVFGTGRASGEGRIEKALTAALQSPMLEYSLKGARGALLNITGPADLTLQEVKEAGERIQKEVEGTAKTIVGAIVDKGARELKITLIATGVKEKEY